jgi:hypothetical protein
LRGKASFGGATFFRFEFTRWRPFAEGFFIALELIEGAAGLSGALPGRFAVRLLAAEAAAAGLTSEAAARFAVGLLRSEAAGRFA